MTRKISLAAARIKAGLQDKLYLGNLDAVRDWGYAPEYVEAMWRILQTDAPDDFVVATGTKYSVKDFLGFTFEHVGLDWEKYVELDPRFLRPSEVDSLVGDHEKVTHTTGWKPTVLPPELAQLMVEADTRAIESGEPYGDIPHPGDRGL